MDKAGIGTILAVIVVLFAVNPARGDVNDANNMVSLSDYLEFAAGNNAELKASSAQFQAAMEQIVQAKTLDNPVLSYGYATERTPQRSEFEIMQMFPWFGTIEAKTEAAAAMARSAGQQYEAKKLAIYYEIKKAYYDYCYLGKAVEITRENLELVRHFEKVAQIKYAASTATQPDVIRAQIESAELENELESLERQRPAIVAKLNSILNRQAWSALPWPKEADYKKVTIDRDMIRGLIYQNNPGLKALDYQIEAGRKGEELAKKRFYPEFGLGVSVDAGMGEDMSSRTMPKVQMSLPIWRGSYHAGERQAQAQLTQAKEERIQGANNLEAEAEEAFYEFENSQRKIGLYGEVIIPKVKEMLAASETAYQAGTIDFLNLIDAQRKFLEYRLMYEKERTDNAKSLAQIEMLSGMELPLAQK